MNRKRNLIFLVMLMGMAIMWGKGADASVTNLRQVDANTYSVRISFDSQLARDTDYPLTVTDSSGVTKELDAIPARNAGSYSVIGLSAGNSYTLSVDGTSIEVVTCPDVSTLKAVQTDATANTVSVTYSGVKGANYYMLQKEYNSSSAGNIYGSSTNGVVTTDKVLSPGTRYSIYAYAARKSSSGYIAYSLSGYAMVSCKTLMSKLFTAAHSEYFQLSAITCLM